MNRQQIDYIIDLLQKGQQIPEDFRELLFGAGKAEYELSYAGKMRKEDILANEDGTFPVPLQTEHVYGGACDWQNLLVFGDNLQFLKTVYKDEDPLIRGKVKGKVKMIYIDPPFATESDFGGKDGEKAYTDKKRGAEFIEFLRRRLIVAKEILAPDGVIYVHLDWKKVHYIKLVLDEVFGENHFKNEIVWKYFGPTSTDRNYPRKHEIILFYTNSENYYFDSSAAMIAYDEKAVKRYDKVDEHGQAYKSYYDDNGKERRAYLKDGKPTDVFEIPFVQGTAKEKLGYPTQKPEALLERFVKASTQPGDLILDFFAGSGTTLAVAEKLGRRWIGCDIGKLSCYIIQKRMYQIQNSKALDSNKAYGQKCRPFMMCTLGAYDLKKALGLEWEQYCSFVAGLFDVELQETNVRGIPFEGKKRGSFVKIFHYQEFADALIDEAYIEEIHSVAGSLLGSRVYMIAPANYVDFLSDYYETGDGTRYYFLKIPYHVINEIHRTPFSRVRQPKSKKSMNGMEEAIGFHFNRVPEVRTSYTKEDGKVCLEITGFKCSELSVNMTKAEKAYTGIQLLSAVLVDGDYDGSCFSVTDVCFQEELEKEASLTFESASGRVMAKFIDIYGNEFSEEVQV